jgi:hypothetical protein
MRTVRVLPAPGGWLVECELSGMPLLFRAGAQAERKARGLALLLARLGEEAEVLVHDRSGRLVGSVVAYPGGAEPMRGA